MLLMFLFAFLLAYCPDVCFDQYGMVEAWTSPLQMKASPATSRRKGTKGGTKVSFPSTSSKKSNKTPPNVKRKQRKRPGSAAAPKQRPTTPIVPQQSQPAPSKAKPKTIGEAVQLAQTIPELLEVASQFWLPSDTDLPAHLRTQALHHERRQRWSAQLLMKLGDACLHHHHSSADDNIVTLWEDERFARAVLAAALPFPSADNDTVAAANQKDLRTLREGLLGLHSLAGSMERQQQFANLQGEQDNSIIRGIRLMLERAETNADKFILPEAMEVRWAARGLLRKLGRDVAPTSSKEECMEGEQSENSNFKHYLASVFPRLEERAKGLPFDILPAGVDFQSLLEDNKNVLESQRDIMTTLQESIPFQFDTIVTRNGASVTERRGTAWVAEDGIGALAYSGKLMPPSLMPPLVRTLMGQVEAAIDAPIEGFFDCALCNYYPDGDSACKFHTDPEHGTMWERLNCVVSVGNSRRFAFRPIPQQTSWAEWDDDTTVAVDSYATVPAVIRLFPGDIVSMWGECNDLFHHAVYPESSTSAQGNDSRRVSLVLKRAMVHGKGRRGHGLAGEGRRSRRQKVHGKQ